MAALAVFWTWMFGGLVVAAAWPRDRALRADVLLIVATGGLLGSAITSVLFFFASLVFARPALVGFAIEAAWAIALVFRLRRRLPVGLSRVRNAGFGWPAIFAATIAMQAALAAGILAVRSFQAEPYGGWDGWAIWNMHARTMLRAGTAWLRLLDAPQLSWTHPDYPRLVPASVARVWAWAGAETPFGSGLISAGFAVATVLLLIAVIAKLRGVLPGLMGGLLLISTPFFATFSTNQHADIPLAGFMLAAVGFGLLAKHSGNDREFPAFAGLCAGAAAWTKNEGLLFALVFAVVWIVRDRRHRSFRGMVAFVGALAIGLVPVAYFKIFLAPSNDLIAGNIAGRIGQFFEAARHRMILAALWRDFARFGEWHTLPYLAMALPFFAWSSRRRLGAGEIIAPIVLLLMLAGYYVVYLATPQDLAWHLDGSLVRLLLQLWPVALLWWCLMVPLPELSTAPIRHPCAAALAFVGLNIAAATAIGGALSRQPAGGELAFRRVDGAEIAATPGEGWFGIERQEKTVWVWSSGNATLHLHASGPHLSEPVTLRFSLRSLNAREITVRMAGRVLWEGRVDATRFIAVEIPRLQLSPGSTAIEFVTDVPGVRESGAPDARTLAFAVYDFRIR